jgi:hypothetical protein
MRHRQQAHIRGPLTAVVVALALTLTSVASASAVVRFGPTPEPVPPRWSAEVPVLVEWAGVSMRFPSEWTVSIKREPPAGMAGGASILAAFGPDDSLCLLHLYDPATVQTWQDVGIEATAELTIGGHRAERFDDMLGTGAAISSAYSIYAPEFLYSLLCHARRAPADRWLSIAETLRLPAAP